VPGVAGERPFYGRFAWAYDLLVDRPVEAECRFVAARLTRHGVTPGARILDAGCGTGRYAAVLAGAGYRVTGVDRAPGLLAVARRRPAPVPVVVGDLVALPLRREYAGALCRGVLNDLLDDDARNAALRGLAGVLRPAGVLVLDVRDWEASVRAKLVHPVHERTVETAQGTLTFRSETRLEPATRSLVISESHRLARAGQARIETHEFVMRCWTPDELRTRLTSAGFGALQWHGGYDEAAAVGRGDRLVVVASRRPEP
jgi:SAM-dependent methyltransferase